MDIVDRQEIINTSVTKTILYYDLKFLYYYIHNNRDEINIVIEPPTKNLRKMKWIFCQNNRLNITRLSFPDRIVNRIDIIPTQILSLNNNDFGKFLKDYVKQVESYIVV